MSEQNDADADEQVEDTHSRVMDPALNPQGLKRGDTVAIRAGSSFDGRKGVITTLAYSRDHRSGSPVAYVSATVDIGDRLVRFWPVKRMERAAPIPASPQNVLADTEERTMRALWKLNWRSQACNFRDVSNDQRACLRTDAATFWRVFNEGGVADAK